MKWTTHPSCDAERIPNPCISAKPRTVSTKFTSKRKGLNLNENIHKYSIPFIVQRTELNKLELQISLETISSLFEGKLKCTEDELQGMQEGKGKGGGGTNLNARQKCVNTSSLSKVLELCQLNLHCDRKQRQNCWLTGWHTERLNLRY